MAQRRRAAALDAVLVAEELLAEHLLDLEVEVVDEHVGGAAFRAGAGEDGGGEDGRHPARRRRVPPGWPVDEHDVPGDVVELVGEVVDGEAALGEEEVLDGAALGGA